jgi:hypothetical protein
MKFTILTVLCKYAFVKINANNYSVILMLLMNDIKTLQEHGLTVMIDGFAETLNGGKLVCVPGDKLSSRACWFSNVFSEWSYLQDMYG